MSIQYHHQNNQDGCCTTSNKFHERCAYKLPLFDCKSFCDNDSNCKGYVEKNDGYCQIATTSSCKFGGVKNNNGNKGDLGGSCGSSLYKGCHIKKPTGFFTFIRNSIYSFYNVEGLVMNLINKNILFRGERSCKGRR